MRGNFGVLVVTALASLLVTGGVAWAVERDFSIVTNQSSIAISGTVTTSFGTVPIQPQQPGSLSTTYTGTIKTDRGTNSIAFLSGSTVDANENGSWKPDHNDADIAEAGDYGGMIAYKLGPITLDSANFAGRSLAAGVTSSPLTIDSGGHFDLSTATVTFSSGKIVYLDSTGSFSGNSDISNKSSMLSGTGTLSSVSQNGHTTETITFPVDSSFALTSTSATINLTLTGQLVATTTFAAGVPGDYNQNGVVDAADYVLWRNQLGSGTSLPNDDTAGVGNDDYTRWRSDFGHTLTGSTGLQSTAAVPEGSTLSWAMIAVLCGLGGRLRQAQN